MRLQAVSHDHAAQAFAACLGLDPQGEATPASAAQAGDCYQLTTRHGKLIYSAAPRGPDFWCYGAAGTGHHMTGAGLAMLEHQGRMQGCKAVAFQTMRQGLIRQAKRHGYSIASAIGTGVIMKKEL